MIEEQTMEDTDPYDGTAVFLLSDDNTEKVLERNDFGDAKATI